MGLSWIYAPAQWVIRKETYRDEIKDIRRWLSDALTGDISVEAVGAQGHHDHVICE